MSVIYSLLSSLCTYKSLISLLNCISIYYYIIFIIYIRIQDICFKKQLHMQDIIKQFVKQPVQPGTCCFRVSLRIVAV